MSRDKSKPVATVQQHVADEFLRAREVARNQEAKSLELRAAMSLTRLYQTQGRQAEARPLLAEICGWFTEGSDTRDLREAKALLGKLGCNPVQCPSRAPQLAAGLC